jgi:hypothetical protein
LTSTGSPFPATSLNKFLIKSKVSFPLESLEESEELEELDCERVVVSPPRATGVNTVNGATPPC